MNRWSFVSAATLVFGLVLNATAIATPVSEQTSALTSSTLSNSTMESNGTGKKFDGTWRLRLMGRHMEDPFNQRTYSEFSLYAGLNYRPLEMVNFNFSPQFRYTNGYAQTQNATNTKQSDWLVRNASMDFTGSTIFDASTGALDQEKMHHPILLEDIAFPAARLDVHTPSYNSLVVGANLESAIATSSSLTTQTKESEKTPTFNSGGAYLKLQQSDVQAQVAALLWQFENLPMSLATSSGLLGNSVSSQDGGTNSEFIYQYKGYETFGKVKFRLNPRFNLGGGAAWVKNDGAPSGQNQGLWGRAFADIFVSKNWMMTPFYEYFRVESDAVVAAYNSDMIFANYVGYRGGLAIEYKKTLRVSLSGGERDAIFLSPNQQREQIWTLKMETLDVAI